MMSKKKYLIGKLLAVVIAMIGGAFITLSNTRVYASEQDPSNLEEKSFEEDDFNHSDLTRGIPDARNIIGTDDRTRVKDTTISPYSSIVRTEVSFKGGNSLGSGTVIGKNTILTAGHVAARFEREAAKGYVFPGKNGSATPFGKFQVKAAYRLKYQDIGIFIVAPNEKGQSVGDVVPRLKISQTASVGDSIMLPGYGGDKGGQQWESIGKITEEDGSNWYYTADATPGNSGSPILNQRNEIIGVHVYGFRDCNGATKTVGSAYDFVKQYLDSDTQVTPSQEEPVVAPTLSGIDNVELIVGEPFDRMAGVKATDKLDGDITSKIKVTGNLDMQKPGSYVLTYAVTNSKGKTASQQRTVTVKAKPAANDTWIADKVYYAGDTVIYKGKTYRAKWWTKNNIPDSSAVWEQVVNEDSHRWVEYISGKSYAGGTIVKYQENLYKAKWWTSSAPGSDSSWIVLK